MGRKPHSFFTLRDANPARGHLPAKIWECLRRNETFRERMEELRRLDRAQISTETINKLSQGNPVAAAAMKATLGRIGPNAVENYSWTKLPRQVFVAIMESVEALPVTATGPREGYTLVAIPNKILTPSHEARVKAALQDFVTPAPTKGQRLSRRGTAFGSPAQWEVFLSLQQTNSIASTARELSKSAGVVRAYQRRIRQLIREAFPGSLQNL